MGATLTSGWEDFYVIVGSSAGGLTGLTFVIMTLVANERGVSVPGLRAFVTPTIVHFGIVLALAAYLSVPGHGVMSLSAGFGSAGLGGLIYSRIVVAANLRSKEHDYVPVGEDWLWNVLAPVLLYCALLVLAILAWYRPALSLYGVAAVALALLFLGIRNAWDIAVWM